MLSCSVDKIILAREFRVGKSWKVFSHNICLNCWKRKKVFLIDSIHETDERSPDTGVFVLFSFLYQFILKYRTREYISLYSSWLLCEIITIPPISVDWLTLTTATPKLEAIIINKFEDHIKCVKNSNRKHSIRSGRTVENVLEYKFCGN